MPTISVIVTSYNIEAYIAECLASLQAQTMSDLEIIVVDDGSSDSTPARIKWHAEQDPRIVPVLLQENTPGGVATAANAGLDRATGDWVGFVDGDDFVEPEMFERLLDAALQHECDLAMCQYDEVVDGTSEAKLPADKHRWNDLSEPAYDLSDPEVQRTFLRFIAVPWRKLYRREMLDQKQIRFPVGDYFFEDNPFHWFSILSAGSIAVVPSVLCHHRMARAGQTMASADEKLLRIFAHHDTIRAFLRERGLDEEFSATLLGWAISQLEWISRRTPPSLYRDLFGRVAPIVKQYDPSTHSRALIEGRKGEYAKRLVQTLAKGDYRAFESILAGTPERSRPVAAGLRHLRESGPRLTALYTARYLRDRVPPLARALDRGPLGSASGKIARRNEVNNADLLFGMAALQNQLERIEQRLDSLESGRREP